MRSTSFVLALFTFLMLSAIPGTASAQGAALSCICPLGERVPMSSDHICRCPPMPDDPAWPTDVDRPEPVRPCLLYCPDGYSETEACACRGTGRDRASGLRFLAEQAPAANKMVGGLGHVARLCKLVLEGSVRSSRGAPDLAEAVVGLYRCFQRGQKANPGDKDLTQLTQRLAGKPLAAALADYERALAIEGKHSREVSLLSNDVDEYVEYIGNRFGEMADDWRAADTAQERVEAVGDAIEDIAKEGGELLDNMIDNF